MTHKVKITKSGVWLDDFKVHGILEKDIELWEIKEGVYQPRLTLKIALDPMSELTINPACDYTGCDLSQDIKGE